VDPPITVTEIRLPIVASARAAEKGGGSIPFVRGIRVFKFIWITVLALAVAGCDSLNQDQLLVRVSSESLSPKSIESKIVSVLTSYAEENEFLDKTRESRVNGTLAYFQSKDEHFPISLGARRVADGVVIDLLHFHPGGGETDAYSEIKRQLLALLKSQFGASVTSVPYGERYEIVRSNP